MKGNLVIASGALAPRSNPESVLWTLDCFGAKGRLAMTGQGVILNEALYQVTQRRRPAKFGSLPLQIDL
jgi:hypothetical protein